MREAAEKRRANEPTWIRRRSPTFGDPPCVDNNSRKIRRGVVP